ncbi:MAG: efflux transporter outer membrane subunit [Bdellovibrionota bacterium]
MLKNIKKVFISFILLLFSACAVGRDYIKPSIETPSKFDAESSKDFTKEIVDTSWWKYFEDKTLSKLVEDAVKGNKDIEQALSRVNQSRALLKEAYAKFLPTTSAGFVGQDVKNHATGTIRQMPISDNDLFAASADASWEIDIFGKLRRNVEMQKATLHATTASLYDATRILVADVANVYFSLRSYQEQLAIAKKNIETQQETLEIVTAKFLAGQVSELDKVRAETQLEATKSITPPLETAIQVNMHRLAVLCGKYPNELEKELSLWEPLKIYNGPVIISDAENLLKTRPDIMMAERNLAAATALIGVNKADYFPRFSISGSLSLKTDDLSKLFHNGMQSSFGPSITWTPLDFGQIRARVKASEERVGEALSKYESTILRAFEDVENSLTAFSAERRRYAMLKKTFELSEKAYLLAKDQYKEGVLDFISVLTAQGDMLNNENNLCKSKERLNSSIVSIYKALGGGWEAWQLVEDKK